eukprot:Gb_29424 [translate_table: standard]
MLELGKLPTKMSKSLHQVQHIDKLELLRHRMQKIPNGLSNLMPPP